MLSLPMQHVKFLDAPACFSVSHFRDKDASLRILMYMLYAAYGIVFSNHVAKVRHLCCGLRIKYIFVLLFFTLHSLVTVVTIVTVLFLATHISMLNLYYF